MKSFLQEILDQTNSGAQKEEFSHIFLDASALDGRLAQQSSSFFQPNYYRLGSPHASLLCLIVFSPLL